MVEGLEVVCIVGCLAQACLDISVAELENGMCTEDGLCAPGPAPAPAVSRAGLLLAAVMLVAAGGVGLARLRKGRRRAA